MRIRQDIESGKCSSIRDDIPKELLTLVSYFNLLFEFLLK